MWVIFFFFSELISSFLTHFFIIQKAVVVVVPKLSFMAAFLKKNEKSIKIFLLLSDTLSKNNVYIYGFMVVTLLFFIFSIFCTSKPFIPAREKEIMSVMKKKRESG